MGFLDHLFKLKHSEEKSGEGKKAPPADPGAFLHPKYFGALGAAGLPLPARTSAIGAKTSVPREIVLTLGDVLSRIPTPLLQSGMHDANRELRFSIDDLSADIARGRAAVPLSKIAALCPDVFARQIAPADDSEIRLPLQKLVEQIGLLRARPAIPPAESDTPPAAAESAPAKDLPPVGEKPAPAPPRAEPVPTPASIAPPAVHIFTPPPPPVVAGAATPDNRGNHAHPAEPDAPATADTNPSPAIHVQPPPVVRPVLVQPPTLLAISEPPSEALSASIPSPPPETAPAPQPPNFPQEALQTLFMTDEPLDLAAVSRHAATLPGVRACVLEWRGDAALAGDAPQGFDLAALHAAASRLPAAGALPVGALENLTLHGDEASVSIFTRPGVLLAALHRPLPPGVRERLAAVATALARQ